jgi:aspartate/methionine/tyrosine aminotransferase
MMGNRREFVPFEMERVMSKWENVVDYNLSESGVHPASVQELIEGHMDVDELLSMKLFYPQPNGIIQLRENIAALYPGATADNVLVTIGAAEANYISTHTILGPGDEMVIMLPNYMQIWGIAQNLGAVVKSFHLVEENDWAPDMAQLDEVVTDKTKLIAVCNPNNPTGRIMTGEEMDGVVAAAERVGAWILADEVYSGAERVTDEQTPSFWGRYDKVLAINSLSKAYGIPGLRVGWVVCPEEIYEDLWARHDYTAISAGMLDNHLSAVALSPEVRPRLIQRTRDYIRAGYPILEGWLEEHEGLFSLTPPQAAAIAFPRYHLDANSTEVVMRLAKEKSVFIVPGDLFGLDQHLRISYGLPPDYLRTGLDRIKELLEELR